VRPDNAHGQRQRQNRHYAAVQFHDVYINLN